MSVCAKLHEYCGNHVSLSIHIEVAPQWCGIGRFSFNNVSMGQYWKRTEPMHRNANKWLRGCWSWNKTLSWLFKLFQPFLCQTFYTLIEYGKTTMFLWMFIEGIILYHMTTVAYSRGPENQMFFYLCGWCKFLLKPKKCRQWLVWPDWAIFCTLGNFFKPVATIILPKITHIIRQFL